MYRCKIKDTHAPTQKATETQKTDEDPKLDKPLESYLKISMKNFSWMHKNG